MRLLRGDRGDAVRDIQVRLVSLGHVIATSEHGSFGPGTERAVREFQERRRLDVDGIVDDHTWSELVEAGYTLGDRIVYLRYPYFRGDDVRELQAALNLLGFDAGREDGIFGVRTDGAVHEFQRNVGLPPDGIVGATTLAALRRLRPTGPGPGRAEVREAEALRRLAASLQGSRIAIDVGHGREEAPTLGAYGVRAGDAAFGLAKALSDELAGRGASPFLVRTPQTDPSDSERARAANQAGAEILARVNLSSSGDTSAHGAATSYYGHEGWTSQAGRRVAELIQRELTSGLGLADLGAHPRSAPILRETRMPAVQVELCLSASPTEEAGIGSVSFRLALARAIADGVEAFFAGREPPASAGLPYPPGEDDERGPQAEAEDDRAAGA